MPLLVFRSLREGAGAIEIDLDLLSIPVVTFAPGAEVSLATPILTIPIDTLQPAPQAVLDLGVETITLIPQAPQAIASLELVLQALPITPLEVGVEQQIAIDLPLLEMLIYPLQPLLEQEQPVFAAGKSKRFRVEPRPITVELELLEIRLEATDPRPATGFAPAGVGTWLTITPIDPTVEWDWSPVRIREEDEALLMEEDLVGLGI